jgi:hypothetical protein
MYDNDLVESIILRAETFFKVVYDRAMTMLMHCFFIEGVAFKEVGLLVLSWWC